MDAVSARCPIRSSPIARGNLIVQMAPHVSRFVARLFCVGPEAEALRAATAAYDDLFRFKIDFVRRRALPLLKGGAKAEATAADHAFVAALVASFRPEGASVPATADAEMALARAGCRLLDREEAARTAGTDAEKAAVAADIDMLKRWVAAHVHHPGYRDWVVFRFPGDARRRTPGARPAARAFQRVHHRARRQAAPPATASR